MNKQEILNEIKKTKEHLANMEKMLAECEYERWKPKENEEFYLVDMFNEAWIDRVTGTTMDEKLYKVYNCFQTREQAETEAEKILVRRMLENIARRLNKGKKPDWIKCYQKKYYLGYDQVNSKITLECRTTIIAQGTVFCLDDKFLNVAIQEIGEERLKNYLRGEQITDKPIVIDGVDVSKCPAMNTYNVFGQEDKPCCYKYHKYCNTVLNCYFKQLKRKEQECEELKEQLDSVVREWEEYTELYKQALDKIEQEVKWVVDNRECYELRDADRCERILDIINKVKEDK